MVFDTLFNAYPQGDVTLQDFVTALTPGAPNFYIDFANCSYHVCVGIFSLYLFFRVGG